MGHNNSCPKARKALDTGTTQKQIIYAFLKIHALLSKEIIHQNPLPRQLILNSGEIHKRKESDRNHRPEQEYPSPLHGPAIIHWF